jgi:RNA-directed DNA polymerase
MVKSEGEQRKSDGVVVPLIAGRNPVGGKGPDFGHAGEAGKRKGMAGAARSNYPGRPSSADTIVKIDNVRRLQRKLWAAAKQSPERRFHALFDRVHRGDVLVEAWRRVRANRGAAGVDRQTLEQVQVYGVERLLGEITQRRPGVWRSRSLRAADGR